MAQVYGAGGKTMPKRGRLGTGSYWPAGTPIFSVRGNTFSGMEPLTSTPDETTTSFGEVSRAAISTQQGRLNSVAIHPNKGFYNTATIPKTPAMVPSTIVETNNLQPVSPKSAALQMPQERNTNSAGGTHKKGKTYKTTFGASKTMPTDSAFLRNQTAMYKHSAKPKPGNAHEAVKTFATSRTVARVEKPLPLSGGLVSGQQRTPPPSFVSRNQLWQDPNNSFLAGTPSAGTLQTGTGRWSMVKMGVV